MPSISRTPRWLAVALTAAIVELTLVTAYIHLGLGGAIFTVNAAGYGALAVAMAIGSIPHPTIGRYSWLPRLALAAFTLVTICAYLVVGPYFTLGWVTKAIELAILTLLAADVMRVHGTPAGLARDVMASFHREPMRTA